MGAKTKSSKKSDKGEKEATEVPTKTRSFFKWLRKSNNPKTKTEQKKTIKVKKPKVKSKKKPQKKVVKKRRTYNNSNDAALMAVTTSMMTTTMIGGFC
eukprot:m.92524 g.92524  ORF g.92524 m.92524 type:complete len:98 (-) comp13356_c0_seq1:1612-1905(-)